MFVAGLFSAFSLRSFWDACPVLLGPRARGRMQKQVLPPAEVCVITSSAGLSACQRLNVSWHPPPPYVPELRHVARGGQAHVCLCACVCVFVRQRCLPSIDGVHQTAAEGVCLVSTLVWLHPVGQFNWRSLSHQVSASCHPAVSCLIKCVCGASEGRGWRGKH